MKRRLFTCLAILLMALTTPVSAVQSSRLSVDLTFTANPYMRGFLLELLRTMLEKDNYHVKLTPLESLNYKREKKLLKEGSTAFLVRLATAERDKEFYRIKVPLTGGLIGKRILLIPQSRQPQFSKIKNLAQLQQSSLTGVFGNGWFDIEIWRANDLPYVEMPYEFNTFLRMLRDGSRGFDYFSRGINELEMAELIPGIVIERDLLFVYDADFYLYMNRQHKSLVRLLDGVLRQAQSDGTLARLQKQYFGYLDERYRLDKRKVIQLVMPDLKSQ